MTDSAPPDPDAHDQNAHHVHEFGHVPRLVHVQQSDHSDDDRAEPVNGDTPIARRLRCRRLGNRLFKPRHLMQYFFNDTLFRTRETRKVCSEELFLDLVIVASVASLGHELRAAPISWPTVEKFILLFAAVYSSWREAVFVWNLWGIHADLIEKAGIYITFVSLVGIALGAHNAFDDGVRPYVAISSFLATLVPITGSLVWAWQERLLKNPTNRVNHIKLNTIAVIVSILPYFAAAFVGSSDATRALYWTASALLLVSHFVPYVLYNFLHRKVTTHTRLAINIELIVEKFEVLTMIVLGETVIGILFEGGAVVGQEGARVGFLYLAAIEATIILYSFQTLYVQVDSQIAKGGVHALRHNGYAGLMWNLLHMPYHFFLILFATGLGISMRDVALPPVIEAVTTRAGASDAIAGAASFDSNARWVFSVGWGGSVICSALIGALHIPGPRAATKLYRSFIRVVLAVALMVGMPFSNVSAELYVGIYAIVTALISISEFLFVQMDRIGFFKSEASMFSSSDSSGGHLTSNELTESDSDSEEVHVDVESGDGKIPGESQGVVCTDDYYLALKERLCKGHCKRFVAVKKKDMANQGNDRPKTG